MRAARRRGSEGVILLLVGGVTVLLLALTFLLLWSARSTRHAAGAWVAATEASLAAQGGMEYASARLTAEGRPLITRTAAGRGDDWTIRQGPEVSGQESGNPSYSHGEPWIDVSMAADGIDNDADGEIDEAGEADRVFTAGEAFRDLDRDGRFSAWSGRLRGGKGRLDLRFALRIDCEEGRIPLNAGLLDALVLNSLGVVAGVSSRREDIQAGEGTEPFQACRIGNDLTRNRPAGGYRSWEEVRRTLTGLDPADYPGGPYTDLDVERIRPFVSLGPHETIPDSGRAPFYAPISLRTAPREVMKAVWMYLCARSPLSLVRPPWGASNDFAGVPPPETLLCPHSGAPFAPVQGGAAPVQLILWPDEAEALAREMQLLRQEPGISWAAVRGRILYRAGSIFSGDAEALQAADPVFRRSWLSCKASLAFQAVAMDPYPFTGCYDGVATWSSWGLDGDPSLDGAQVPPMIGLGGISRIQSSAYTSDPKSPITPQGFTLAAPVRFSVESRGWGAAAPGTGAVLAGNLRAAERLELSSQEDFENLTGAPLLAERGIRALEVPSAAERKGCAPGAVSGIRIASLPCANPRSGPGFEVSRLYGALGLGPLEAGRQGAGLYWRFTEDYDKLANLAAKPPWWECWSEWDASNTTVFPSVYQRPFTHLKPPYRCPTPRDLKAGSSDQPTFGEPPVPWTMRSPYKISGFEGALERFGDDWSQVDIAEDLSGFRAPWCGVLDIDLINETIPLGAIEAWMGPESLICVEATHRFFSLEARRGWKEPNQPGIFYSFRIHWEGLRGSRGGIIADASHEWFLPDPQVSGGRVPLTRHVVLRFRRMEERTGSRSRDVVRFTRFSLFVDGSHAGDFDHRQRFFHVDNGRLLYENGELWNFHEYSLNLRCVAELRLWGTDGGASSGVRYAMGRYLPKGTFLSPLYSLDASARLLQAQWTGVVPAGFLNGGDLGTSAPPFTVEVEGYSDPEGNVSLGTRPLGETSADVADLSSAFQGPVRAFRYRVTIDAARLSGVLDETPLFESIWFLLRRRGSAGWSSWELR